MEYKGYQIRTHLNNPRCYIIITPGKGGRNPKAFDGVFTDKGTAMRAIDSYLDSKDGS